MSNGIYGKKKWKWKSASTRRNLKSNVCIVSTRSFSLDSGLVWIANMKIYTATSTLWLPIGHVSWYIITFCNQKNQKKTQVFAMVYFVTSFSMYFSQTLFWYEILRIKPTNIQKKNIAFEQPIYSRVFIMAMITSPNCSRSLLFMMIINIF